MTESIAGKVLPTQSDTARRGVAWRALASPTGVAVLVGAIALLLRVYLLWRYPFDGLYGQDAYFYLTATERLVQTWTNSTSLTGWLTDWGTPPISEWPLGYHLQVAVLSLVTGLNAHAGQLVSLLTGTLTPALTTFLFLACVRLTSRESAEKRAGLMLCGALLSGLIVAVAPLAVQSSVVFMSDMPALFWATAGVLAFARWLDSGHARPRLSWVAGTCLAVACVSRYVYVLMLIPVLACLLASYTTTASGKRSGITSIVGRSLSLLLPVVLLLGLQLGHNVIHPMASGASPAILTWNPLHAFEETFDGPDGHASYGITMGQFFVLRPLLASGPLVWLLTPLFVLGLVALAIWRALRAAILIAGWWLLFAIFYSGNIYQADRFILSYLPPIAVLCGLGLIMLLPLQSAPGAVSTRMHLPRRLALLIAAAAFSACLAALMLNALRSSATVQSLQRTKEDYLAAARCVESVAGGTLAPVYSFGVTFTIERYTSLQPKELYFESPESVDATLGGSPRPVRGYLVLQEQGFEAQWGNTPLGETYRHLKTGYKLSQVECPATTFSVYKID